MSVSHFARIAAALLLLQALPVAAQTASPSFPDVGANHPDFSAIEFVKARGIISGYSDGTFRPDQLLTRAAAAKILVLTKTTDAEAQATTDVTFTDIPAGAWYRVYAETALKHGIISPADSFSGEKPVKKAEFLKMLFAALGANVNAFDEIMLPLAPDVTDTNAWFYRHVRYAISTSLIRVKENGKLEPERELTRADAARLLYGYSLYQAGKRTQTLLNETEAGLLETLDALDTDLPQAQYASARALLAARGAHGSKPTVGIVQGAVKTAEAFRAIVRAYKAGNEGRLDDVIALAKDAWALAEKARQLSPDLGELSGRVQEIAGNMAQQARELQAQGT